MSSKHVPSIWARKGDLVVAITFIIKFALALAFDYQNAVAPANGIKKSDLDAMSAVWPPRVVTDLYWNTWMPYDPLLQQNPVWLKVGCAVSAFLYAPFYLFCVYGLIMGKNWIQKPILVWSWGLIFTMVLIIAENVLGPLRTPDPAVFALVYGVYLLMPVWTLVRYWQQPYPEASAGKHKSA